MTKIYFVRHADSRRSDGKRHDERTPLNKNGDNQAKLVANYLASQNEFFGGLASSPAKRTRQTADKIAEQVAVFIEIMSELKEVGRFVNGFLYDSEENEIYSVQRQKAMEEYNIDWRYHKNDESLRDLFQRSLRANQKIIEAYEDQVVIICGHSQPIIMQHCGLIYGQNATAKQIIDSYKYFFLKNTGISILEKNYRKSWQLLRFNITDHLPQRTPT